MTVAAPVFETSAELLRWVPISPASTSGKLKLDGDVLSFTTAIRGRVVFEAPVSEFHSVAPMTTLGLHIWRGTTRYRFAIGAVVTPVHGVSGNDAVDGLLAAASIPAVKARDARNRSLAAQWMELLEPRVGPRPSSVKVRRPWPFWTWIAGVVGAAVAVIGGLVAASFIFG